MNIKYTKHETYSDIRVKENGVESLEVSDNGSGYRLHDCFDLWQ